MIDIETNDFAPSSSSSSTTTNRAIIAHKNSKQILLEIEHVSYFNLINIYKYYNMYNLMFCVIFRCTYHC